MGDKNPKKQKKQQAAAPANPVAPVLWKTEQGAERDSGKRSMKLTRGK